MKNARNYIKKSAAFFLVGMISILLFVMHYWITNTKEADIWLDESMTISEDWEYYVWNGEEQKAVESRDIYERETDSRIRALRMVRILDNALSDAAMTLSLKGIGVEVFLGDEKLYSDFSYHNVNENEYHDFSDEEFVDFTQNPRNIKILLPADYPGRLLTVVYYYPSDWKGVILDGRMYPVIENKVTEIAPAIVDITTTVMAVTFCGGIIVIICVAFLLGIKEGQYHWHLMFLIFYYITLIIREIYDSVLVSFTVIPDWVDGYYIGRTCLVPLFLFVSLWFYSGWRKRAAFITALTLGAGVAVEYFFCNRSAVYQHGSGFEWLEAATLVLFAFWIYREYRNRTMVDNKRNVLCLIPLTIFFAAAVSILEAKHMGGYYYYWVTLLHGLKTINPTMLLDLITETLALVVTFLVIQSVFQQSVNIRKKVVSYEMKSRLAIEKDKNNRKNVEKLRELKHELRHHIVTLHGFLEAKEYKRAMDYMEMVDSELKKLTPLQYSRNLLVDAIVNSYAGAMKENNIIFNHDLSLPEEIFIEDIDLNMILSNLMENAVEACVNSGCTSKRYISLFMTLENDILYIIIHNYSENKVKFDQEGNIRTSKQNQTAHGLGINMIRRIVHKYNGEIQIQNQNNEFKISIFMNQKKSFPD